MYMFGSWNLCFVPVCSLTRTVVDIFVCWFYISYCLNIYVCVYDGFMVIYSFITLMETIRLNNIYKSICIYTTEF